MKRVCFLLIYTFSLYNLCAQNCDTLRLSEVRCDGDSIFLADTFFLNSGNFEIRIPKGDCDSIILLSATFRSLPDVFIEGDSAVCDYETTLIIDDNFDAILWSTGDVSSQIQIGELGLIWVDVTDNFGCTNRDSIEIINGFLNLQIDGDSIYCPGFTSSLIANPVDGIEPFSYSWFGPNNLSWNLDVVNATDPGTYCLEVFDSRGCFETTCITIDTFVSSTIIDTMINPSNGLGGGSIDITMDG
ncbi:MAG: hypothetical protein AAGK97_18795, partial [Bacteroidota bacterium]